MTYQLQATLKWQRTAWQIIGLALLLMTVGGLATAQNELQTEQKGSGESFQNVKLLERGRESSRARLQLERQNQQQSQQRRDIPND